MGIIGNLTASEIIEQLIHANNVAAIRNVVFMGMGEPLNNYENVKSSVEFMIDSKRFGLCKLLSPQPLLTLPK
jgi:adenine C2-methylase RlmN of 23S rRNA A2503 and tRNA A37